MLARGRLVDLWDRMNTSYWFVPSVMFIGAVSLALLAFRIDLYLERSDAFAASPWFPKFSSDGARSILATLASGMLTVTGVVFSLTIVALQLASTQFGPRLLRTFMTSRGTQVVLGTFTSSFVYYLLIDGTVRGDVGFVPQISTATGIVLGAVDIAVLIYFVHHLANSIRIESLLATVSRELGNVIDELFPAEIGLEQPHRPEIPWEEVVSGRDCRAICAAEAGYIRHIDSEMLISTACRHDLVLRLEQRPGGFVVASNVLMSVVPARAINDEVEKRLRESVVLGRDRTPRQDASFALRHLVEVAQRALSPGINDPFTAIECVNCLAEALCTVARRPIPPAHRFDAEGRLRVIAEPMRLQAMAEIAFDPIARAGGSNGDIALRLLDALLMVADCAPREDRRRLLNYALRLEEQMRGQMPLERDRCAIQERVERALGKLEPTAGAMDAEARRTAPAAMTSDAP